MTESATNHAPMPEVLLGRTGITTSRLSIGTWGFGDAERACRRAVPSMSRPWIGDSSGAAFAAGIRFLDSAEAYEANEKELGRLLKEVDAPSDVVVASKFGHGKGFTGDLFRRSVEESLAYLGLEKIELMMVHDPRNEDDMAVVMGKGGALEELRKMQDEGIVGSIGVATGTFGPLRTAVDSDEFDADPVPENCSPCWNRTAKTSKLARGRASAM